MFLGGYVSFALRGKFSQLDFNQFNFCRQRLCMGDLFFEQGIGLFNYKAVLSNTIIGCFYYTVLVPKEGQQKVSVFHLISTT